jgi:hypothetical protein
MDPTRLFYGRLPLSTIKLSHRDPTVSLNLCPMAPIPEETARVARATFPKGNRYMTMRDELGVLYPWVPSLPDEVRVVVLQVASPCL